MNDEARDILQRILRFVAECEQERDKLVGTDDAFLRKVGYKAIAIDLIQIGESVNKLQKKYAEILAKQPNIPWRQIIGLRNIIVHSYDNILEEEIEEALKMNLPELKVAVESLLK
ncbi:MAG: DUF86 domain-containing protein [Candidatus Nomurabacteria bacterium]|jgi:uncharacterized protein with HEPN domain|nr:DUF86 domain-containing protein [Candidatus Nomurabacteria bacterium]